ncbi:MAG: HNH endonuclease [Metamycoplasmataceae bacterium]
MSKLSEEKVSNVWNKGDKCNCNERDCDVNHRICALCKKKLIKVAYEGKQPESQHTWNVDHKKSKLNGGDDSLENLQLTCVSCNRNKGSN